MILLESKYQTAPVLVTGAGGFIGSRIVESLNQSDHQLISVDRKDRTKTRPQMKDLKFGVQLNDSELFSYLDNEKPKLSAIYHMGACSNTMELDSDVFQKLNIEASQNIWNYCSKNQIPLVYASSAATYGDGELGYDDDENKLAELKPLNPYGQSKQDFDLWALHQEKKGNHPPSWSGFKFFNVYGYGENHKGKMASVVLHGFEQIQNTGKVRLFKSHRDGISDGHQSRDFIFVEDVVSVMNFALNKPIKRGIFNLGTGRARTFLDLAKATFKAMDKEENIEFFPTPEKLRDKYQYFTQATMKRIHDEGYPEEFTSLEDGVEKYVKRLLNDWENGQRKFIEEL